LIFFADEKRIKAKETEKGEKALQRCKCLHTYRGGLIRELKVSYSGSKYGQLTTAVGGENIFYSNTYKRKTQTFFEC
jgi:hypothetical protein